MKIDAHQHFWRLSKGFYGWLTPELEAIYADFEPAQMKPLLAAAGIDGTVTVQAVPDMRETEFLLRLAEKNPFIRGVVGWIDMETKDGIAALKRFGRNPLFKGIRPMIQEIMRVTWMLDAKLDPAYQTLVDLGLSFDALVKPQHLDTLAMLIGRHLDLSIIIDHGGKPAIREGLGGAGGFDAWAPKIDRLARFPNVACKLSGLLTEAGPGATLDDLMPYLDHLYDVFGASRLMWGSDWPVLLLESDYARWNAMFAEWLSGKPDAARDEIMGGTATRLYRLQ
jgi:L-fuconolactonase